MGDHTDLREPNAFFRGLLAALVCTAAGLIVAGFVLLLTGVWS